MIVEFTGFAGVGKSYIRTILQLELEKMGIIVQNDSSFSKLNYLLSIDLGLFIKSIFYVKRLKPKNVKAWIRSTIVWYKIQCKLKYYSSFQGIVLVDEGYLHKFRLIRRNSLIKNIDLGIAYCESFYQPDIVILVESSFKTLKLQVKKRDKMDLKITKEDYNKSINNTKLDIDNLIQKNSKIKFINIENDELLDIEELIRKIYD